MLGDVLVALIFLCVGVGIGKAAKHTAHPRAVAYGSLLAVVAVYLAVRAA